MAENEIGDIVVEAALKVHSKLGAGLLESVYEACLYHELARRALHVERQLPFPILYDDLKLGYLLNFDVAHMKDGIKRIVNKL